MHTTGAIHAKAQRIAGYLGNTPRARLVFIGSTRRGGWGAGTKCAQQMYEECPWIIVAPQPTDKYGRPSRHYA